VKIEIVEDQLDAIVVSELKEILECIEKTKYSHEDDVKFYKKFTPALKMVIDYYGKVYP